MRNRIRFFFAPILCEVNVHDVRWYPSLNYADATVLTYSTLYYGTIT